MHSQQNIKISFVCLLEFYLAALSVAQTIMGTPGEVTSVGRVECEEIHATLSAENVTPLTGTLVERNENKRCVCVCVCVWEREQQVFSNNVVHMSVITLHFLISTLLAFTRRVHNRWMSFHYYMTELLKLEIAKLNNDVERKKLVSRATFLYTEYTETVTRWLNP
jgi:hypothetical protein